MLARTPLEQLLTVDNVVAWLRTMPAEGVYEYANCVACALWKFCRAHGYFVSVWPGYLITERGSFLFFSDEIQRAVVTKPHTYGDALARLEAVL